MKKFLLLAALYLISIHHALAKNQTINLHVSYKTVYFTGKAIKAIAVNNQIPAPTLHFKEGDHVTINVYNHLDKETAIHWHGILVPWQMDGVKGITQQGILPGQAFQYQFTLRQSGTYWYHAHAGLQEQQGLYGAFLIDPAKHPNYRYTKDYVITLSDWSNTDPEQILKNLKKEGDYYSPNFPLQPSLFKFIYDYRKASSIEKTQLIADYKMMQQMRMNIYDINDIAYDTFLLNGKSRPIPWTSPVSVGDIVRLRFIGAGSNTIFHVKIPNTSMKMVQADGNDVKPYSVNDFIIAPGETYDVLVKIQKNKPYIIYAESIDTSGSVIGALTTSLNQQVDFEHITPFPEPIPVTREMMAIMMGKMKQGMLPEAPHESTNQNQEIKTSGNMQPMPENMHMDSHEMGNMDHSSMANMTKSDMPAKHAAHADMPETRKMQDEMSMPTEPSIIGDKLSLPNSSYKTSSDTKYQKLVAAVRTNDPNKPISQVLNMELFGYMDQFVWFINGVPEHKAPPITLEPGKRYRFVFTNTSMMHHPMHIHGHWFILRNGNGAYDPLLHTIDVPPGATITADVDTDASGQWIFHCHLLYHMVSGMARTFQYSTLLEITKNEAKPQSIIKTTAYHNRPIVRIDETHPIDHELVMNHMAHPVGIWFASYLDIGVNPFTNVQRLTYKGLYGPDYNKLELVTSDAEMKKGKIENADIDIFYWHLINQFWSVKGGINYFYRPANSPYWQPGIGIEGVMPYFINTDARVYYKNGGAKFDIELSRDTQISNNFFFRLGVRSILATNTDTSQPIGSGLNQVRYIVRPYYRLMPGINVFAEYENERDYGAYQKILKSSGESTSEGTFTLGLTWLL